MFENQELFDIYEMLLCMANSWITDFDQFCKDYPKSAKIKNKASWEKKFYELCFKARKANKRNLTLEDCHILFSSLMIP